MHMHICNYVYLYLLHMHIMYMHILAVLPNFCGGRVWYQRLYICNEFTGRQGQGGSQKRSQTLHKFVGGEG